MKKFLLLLLFVLNISVSAQDFTPPTPEEILKELNFARTKPQEYADFLAARREYYKGKWYNAPEAAPMLTLEGITAVDDAIAYLRQAKPMPALTLSDGMTHAAEDFVLDAGKNGLDGHIGSDGSMFNDRIAKYGTVAVDAGECVCYSFDSAREIVAYFIIDDGVASRGHRKNIFNNRYRFAGIAYGEHAKYFSMCVLDFAASFTEN